MIDRYLAWLNCNIEHLDVESKNKARSRHDRRRLRYQRDILNRALEAYMANGEKTAYRAVGECGAVNSTGDAGRCVTRPRIRIVGGNTK